MEPVTTREKGEGRGCNVNMTLNFTIGAVALLAAFAIGAWLFGLFVA